MSGREVNDVPTGADPKTLRCRANALAEEVRELRRRLHMHPELGGGEERTAALVVDRLRSYGLEVTGSLGGHGVMGLLRGTHPGPTVALRADMDALPMDDAKEVSYRSRISGVMHACGHDAHTAILLTTARLLSEITDGGHNLGGNVKFLFQPDEEGDGGALPMLEAGVFKDPDVDVVYALHVNPEYPTGTVASRAGVVVGYNDEIKIDVYGRAAHGARPQTGVDAIVVAAGLINALQTLVSRETSPLEAASISLGTISGGYRNTVIAPHVTIEGTIMCLDARTRCALRSGADRLITGIAASMGAEAYMEYKPGYPAVENDEALVERVRTVASRHLDPGSYRTLEEPSIGGEDFSYFGLEAPGCLIALGVADPSENSPAVSVHNSLFDIDEEALVVGVTMMAGLALDYLS